MVVLNGCDDGSFSCGKEDHRGCDMVMTIMLVIGNVDGSGDGCDDLKMLVMPVVVKKTIDVVLW